MRRRSDGWLNATQILKIAGVDKGKRTKVLEKEILTGEHEKVQGGYGKYQGTWISYKRGREFCRQYGVEDILRPLLDYDVSSDGTGGQGEGQHETPTKEQAMAANRKRFYNPSFGEPPRPSSGTLTNGTLFSGSTASAALSAINKAARLNSPAPRPGSNFRRPDDPFPGGSQQSMVSDGSFHADGKYHDSGYSTHVNGEPPRKRLRADSTDGMAPHGLPMDASMRSATPTEPNESFLYDTTMTSQEHTNGNGDPVALPPLPSPNTEEQQEKMALILDLFAENAGRTDYASHPALQQLSGEDLNTPLDASANNALHWAATLAKVPLLKLLVQRGANIHRGNAAGQSPLISAVLVNNSWERSCFPDMLELLGGLIEVRDSQGRTILHHIAVSSGINGRGKSSKYYLEALLEFLVRIGRDGGSTSAAAATIANNMQALNGDVSMHQGPQNPTKGSVSLIRFLSHIVNARDKAGNTALNLVARIGNRSIIQQLLEIHADPALPNYKGVSAKDFGVGVGIDHSSQSFTQQSNGAPSTHAADAVAGTQDTMPDTQQDDAAGTADQVEDQSQSLLASMTEMLNQSLASHKDLLKQKSEEIDRLNAQIKELSNFQKAELDKVAEMKERVRARGERQAKIAALRQALAEKRQSRKSATTPQREEDWLKNPSSSEILEFDQSGNGTPNPIQRTFLANNVPSSSQLKASIAAYAHQNTTLQQTADDLRARSAERQAMYRRVVALCTGVDERKVEESLPSLLAAIESERGAFGGDGEGEVRRVREFLRKVEPGAAGVDGGGV